MDMSFVFSISQNKKTELENFKKITAIAAIPIAIEGYAWVKALQVGISIINYLCTADNLTKLSDELFDFRGPVLISDVTDISYLSKFLNLQEKIVPEPAKDGSYKSNSKSALDRFLKIETIVGNQIKQIKEPNT